MIKRIISVLICIVLFCSVLCSCQSGVNKANQKTAGIIADDPSKKVELTWYISIAEPKGFSEVMQKANEYLGKKLNASLKLVCIEPGDYESKVQLALASGENLDIIWTSNWKNKYQPNVTKGAYLALDKYLDLPELKELKDFYNSQVWDAARISNKIYGVPMNQVLYNQSGIWFVEDYMKKYNIDPYACKSIEDIDNIYETVKAGESSDVVITTSSVGMNNFDPDKKIWSEITTGFNICEGTDKVVFREERNMQAWKHNREYYEKGYFPSDVATTDYTSYLNEKKIVSGTIRYLPGVEGKRRITYGYNSNIIPTTDKVMSRNSVQSTLNSISANSKNPVRALKLIQLLQFDEYLMNLICYGIEGRDYKKDPSNPKRMERESGAYYVSEFMIGNQFLAYLVPSYEDGVWEETIAENKAARADPFIGFSFDPTPVQSEISQISAVEQQYTKILGYGLQDPEEISAEYYNKLDLAGRPVVKDEVERQVSEWLKTQK